MSTRVPTDQGNRDLALVKKGLTESYFIDPANPAGRPDQMAGSWRSLDRSTWTFAPHWENFVNAWNQINFPRMFGNTLFYAVITEIGVLISCTLVAYGFARFRFPGKDLLFTDSHCHDLPAGDCHDHPDVHLLFKDRLGRHVAAADRADVLCQCL